MMMMDQWGLDSLDHLTWEDIQHYSSYPPSLFATTGGASMDYSSPPPIETRPREVAKSSSWDSSCTDEKPAATIIFFANPDSPGVDPSRLSKAPKSTSCRKQSYGAMVSPAHKATVKPGGVTMTRPLPLPLPPPSRSQDHVLAERKRRENLTRKFIALSAVVPGLKKMDKASILEDAIKYLNQLQERVKSLEGQAAKRAAEEKKTQMLSAEDGNSSSDENLEDRKLNGIEVRLSEESVLVKIHCNNGKGVLVKALSEIENLNLSVISTSVVPFATSLLDITIIAQIEEGFSTTAKDLVKNLNSALRN